jgi:hypothetical protein
VIEVSNRLSIIKIYVILMEFVIQISIVNFNRSLLLLLLLWLWLLMTMISVMIIIMRIVVTNYINVIVVVLILNEKLWRIIKILINRFEIIDILKVDDFRFIIIKKWWRMFCFIWSTCLKDSRLSLKRIFHLWSTIYVSISHCLRDFIIIIIVIYLNIVIIDIVIIWIDMIIEDNIIIIIIVSINIHLLTIMLNMHIVSNTK